jgi:tetratricopeptide (TPR) repeat protein
MFISLAQSRKCMMRLGFKSLASIALAAGAILICCPQFGTAIAQHKSSTVIAQNDSDIKKIEQEAADLYGSGKYSEAIAKLEQLLTIYRAKRDRAGEGKTLNNLGAVHYSLGQYQKTIEYYTQSLLISKEIGDLEGEGRTLNNLGALHYSLGQYQKAIEHYTQSLSISKKIGDRAGERAILNNLGAVHNALGQYQKAIEYYSQSLSISQEMGDRVTAGTTLSNLGGAYDSLGQYQKAIEYYTQSLSISKEVGDRAGEGRTLGNLGEVHRSLGQYQKAIEYHTQSLSITKEIGDRAGEGNTLSNLGKVYQSLGQYQKAIDYYTQSLSIRKEVGDRAGEGTTLGNLGVAHYSLGQYQKAIEYYTQSLSIRKEIGDQAGEGATLNNLGAVYRSLGQYQKAIEYYAQSLLISKKTGDRAAEGTTLNNLGVVHQSIEQYQKAIEYFTQSLPISKEIGNRAVEGTTLDNIGGAYAKLGQHQKAIQYHIQSLSIRKEIGDQAGEGITLNSLGTVYHSLKQYPKATEYYTQSLSIRKKIGDRAGEQTTLYNMGSLHYELRKLPDAEKFLRQSISIAESLKVGLQDKDKISFGETIADTYKLLQKVLIEQGKPSEALEISERARARALAELLVSKVNTINNSAQDKIRKAPNLSKIQQIAKQKNTTLVQYSLIDDKIYIWVIAPTGKISFKQTQLPPNTTIKDLVLATRKSLGVSSGNEQDQDESKPTVTSDLKQLYQLLIAPIAQDLPKDPNALVTILPQDQLLLIPFAALQEANGQYLIDRHTISIAPSIQVLGLTQTANNSRLNSSPLVIGDPKYPPMPKDYHNQALLEQLGGAVIEAQSVGAILKTQPLIGDAADKKEVIKRMQRASLIHLATHGFPDRVEGELPGAVALTNGFLTSDEIFDMQLQANLVVLSACDTGRGDITGDGVIGLSRSFAVAGVPSLVVSLWMVDDAATKVLMEEFYEQLWVKKLPKAQAMRQAMLKTKQQYDKPDYWASFMLVGEGK